MKIEKEPVRLKNFKLQASGQNQGGKLSFDGRDFKLSALQFSYAEILKSAGTIEGLVNFYLGQGWLVQFSELYTLIEFLVNENLITNPSFRAYLNHQTGFDGSAQVVPKTISVTADSLPFFRSLEKTLAQHLLQNSVREKIPAQAKIVSAGSQDRDLFILLEGQAGIYRIINEKQRQLVSMLNPGALFGERGFLLNQPRTADIITTKPSEILRVPHLPEFDHLIRSDKAKSLQHRFWVLQALSSSPFFKDLPNDSLDNLIFSGKLVQAKAGQCLFNEGQPGNACYVVIQGSLVVSQKGKNINVMNQGSCFGEISLLASGGTRTATITVQQDTILLEINQQNFYRVLAQNLILAKEIEALAAQRLQKDAERLKK